MAKIELKYVNQYLDRHGRLRRYFRRGSQRGSLPGDIGSPEFNKAYAAYMAGGNPENEPKTVLTLDGSFGKLITAFYNSRGFREVSPSSRRTYRHVLEPLAREHGHRDIKLTRQQAEKLIADIGERRPAMGNLTKSVLRQVFEFAVRQGLRDDNPFIGIRPFKAGSHHSWNEAELKKFEDRWPLGTRERLAYALLLHTAQRVGDVSKMRRQDIANGELYILQQKTGIELYLPVLPELELALKAYPAIGLTLIGTETGKPMTSVGLSAFMRRAIEKAGLPGRCRPHGLRKARLRRLAEEGASASQIAAWSGHRTLKEVSRYTAAADQRRMARDAMKKR
jgi:integrase